MRSLRWPRRRRRRGGDKGLFRDKGIAAEGEAEEAICGVADTDARGGVDGVWGKVVAGQGERGLGVSEVEAVVGGAGDGEGLAEASGAGGE